jgi:ATP-dependent helicase HrpA
MSRADLMQRDVPEAGGDSFPTSFPVGGNPLPLLYKFDPAEPGDGVTLVVPEPLLDVVNAEQIAWLVPGMRLEKVIAIFRALPKAQRKLLVPVPDFARSALDDLAPEVDRLGRLPGFHEWLADWVTQRVGMTVAAAELAALPLPDHLRMNLRVLDARDYVVAEDRDLLAIKRKLYATAQLPVATGADIGSHAGVVRAIPAHGGGKSAGGGGVAGASYNTRRGIRAPDAGVGTAGPSPAVSQPLHRQWDFGDLPESREVERNRLRLVVYPALEDRGSGVALIEARNGQTAEAISRGGMVRLAILSLAQQAKYIGKRVADDRDLVLLSRGLSLQQSIADAMTQRAFRECFLPAEIALPRDGQAFNRALEERRGQLSEVGDRLVSIVTSILREWRAARAAVDGLRPGSFADAVADVDLQLRMLLPPDFIESTPRPWLDYLPRYFKAATRRIERLRANERRDAELAAKVKPFSSALRNLMAEPAINGVRPELDQLRWMIEEFRVSLFAQELKTVIRVSEKRLSEQLALARDAQR